jgi:hypothetical protein
MTDKPKGFDPNQLLGIPEEGGRAEIWIGYQPSGRPESIRSVVPRPSFARPLGSSRESSARETAPVTRQAGRSSRPPDRARAPIWRRASG